MNLLYHVLCQAVILSACLSVCLFCLFVCLAGFYMLLLIKTAHTLFITFMFTVTKWYFALLRNTCNCWYFHGNKCVFEIAFVLLKIRFHQLFQWQGCACSTVLYIMSCMYSKSVIIVHVRYILCPQKVSLIIHVRP